MKLAEFNYEKNRTALTRVREDRGDYSKRKQVNNQNKRSKLLKRIPLKRLMDLKIDYAFKQLFGNEKNKDITVVFLNAILQKTGRNQIRDISFSNTESGAAYVDDKQSRMDLLVVTNDNEWINIEIQFSNKYDMIKRSIFYWAGIYRNPLEKGMTYKQLRPVIAINILNFDLFSQTERFHTSYHLYEDADKFKLTNVMELHFIEMTKLIKAWKDDKLNPWNNVLARWLLMLGMVDRRNGKVYEDIYTELEGISMKDESLHSAFQNWEELSMTQEQYLAYESRLKHIMDEEAAQREMELREQELKRKNKEMQQKSKEIQQKSKEIQQKNKEMQQRDKEIQQRDKEIQQKNKEIQQKDKELQKEQEEIEHSRKELKQKNKELEQRIILEMQKEKESMAHQLLANGLDIEFVAKLANLTVDRLIEIQRDIEK